ncbi:hypothetical protein, conserved [Trypanosoma brucei gambiense DAL972]|uniref:Paraflagellar rod component n=2 Tax=Trypanosoma brucei TaxID=5691 RepID=D0A8Y3_TRYB9|nr:hypothetical protein, conserved [Trypanosoma brucei gambiense DAL972]RHW67918.1 paraflagellar rod component [Trypanosoma brucei equiperdum]CBH18134.1 hypothetical protein, conserved [Trypanosoma brucei gambiense DAL972]|eukprot:XP_011780398.1 hypothetical protein, conserved [Trypanosoma brucei gambiense DAL972]
MKTKFYTYKNKPSSYAQVSTILTMSHEVVDRVSVERAEDGQFAYYMAKCEYNAVKNRISGRLPPIVPLVYDFDEDDLSNYCSSTADSRSATLRRGEDMDLDCTEIDGELLKLSAAHRERDIESRGMRKMKPSPLELILHRETLARGDINHVESLFFRRMVAPFRDNPMFKVLDFFRQEQLGRKQVEDEWASESMPFLEMCRMEQTDYMEDFLIRAIRGKNKYKGPSAGESMTFEKVPLDVRLYAPLKHRCDIIRSETESEQEIAFYYLMLGQAAQRDLVEKNVICRNPTSGLMDSVQHPIDVSNYEAVDLAFSAECRYLQQREETGRMEVINLEFDEKEAILAAEEEKKARAISERRNRR